MSDGLVVEPIVGKLKKSARAGSRGIEAPAYMAKYMITNKLTCENVN
jgi:hypothetical protein